MNQVFIIGKIITDIDFKFIYNKYKDLDKNKIKNKIECKIENSIENKEKYKHISISSFFLGLLNGSVIEVYGYDEIAEYMYRHLKNNEIILCSGMLDSYGKIEVFEIECIKKED